MSDPSDQANAALHRARQAAEGGEPAGPSSRLPPELWEGLDGAAFKSGLEAILIAPRPDVGLDQLQTEGALAALLPEVEALVGFGEGGRQHKDVWDHTKRVVTQSPEVARIRWAALLHDIGKVPTRRTEPDGQVQFHGHAEVGARMVSKLLRRLEFDKTTARTIRLLVLFHQRPSQYEPSWTDSAVRRFGRETAEVFDDLLALSRADMTTKYDTKRRRGHELIDDLSRRAAEIRELDERIPPLPKGLGTAIIERFSLAPGPRIGVLRDAVEAAVDRGELDPQQDADVYLQWLGEHLDEL